MVRKSKPTQEQKELAEMQKERERQLRVENARETTKSLSDQRAFRRRLRGFVSLLSNGFKGFSS